MTGTVNRTESSPGGYPNVPEVEQEELEFGGLFYCMQTRPSLVLAVRRHPETHPGRNRGKNDNFDKRNQFQY
jgi:hypothetical protein